MRAIIRISTIMILAILVGTSGSKQKAETEMICVDCHNEKLVSGESHFVDNSDDCLFCHEVTSVSTIHEVSTYSSNVVCEACHPRRYEETLDSGHADLSCSNCHDPHGSNNEKMLMKPVISLCMESCHTDGDLGLSHPVGADKVDRNIGSSMTCVSTCHSIQLSTSSPATTSPSALRSKR